ncbi:MAG: DUF3592 domain-containing protein [Akkermansiaceae bacterium]|nr:DUF3592 domain-containing protein [Akkermansiaceae bacterium]
MSKTIKSARGLLVFGLFWTAFSSIFLIIGLKTGYDALNRAAWPETPCEVTSFEVVANPNTDPAFQPSILYTYQWEGVTHTGDRVWADQTGENDYEDLAGLIEQHRDGKLKSCHVNPESPGESVLLAGSGDAWGGLVFAIFGASFVAIGIGMIIFSRKQKKNESSALSSQKSSGDAPRAIMIPFFSAFGLAGLGVLVFAVIPQWIKYTDAKGWRETPAEVIWSRIQSHSDDDGTTYSVDIFYGYEFGGKQYKSNTIGLMSGSSSGRDSKQEKVNQHPKGKKITCYVNPDKPWQALLERDLGWWALFALFPIPFIGVGVGGLWWMLRKKPQVKNRGLSHSANTLLARNNSFDSLRQTPDSVADSPVSARRTFSPGGKRIGWFFGAIAFALFWNGITSVFVWQAVKAWQRGNPEWFLTIFITPFVLIGLGFIGHVFYRFLALFNPSPKLTLTPGDITLGEPAKLAWRLSGGSHRLTRFAIYLVGEEEAKYQRGTDTVTETEVFYEQALIDTPDPRKSISGAAEIRLDTGTMPIMPTWKSKHNRIKWSVHVKGEISVWPDVSDKYDIKVRPSDIAN